MDYLVYVLSVAVFGASFVALGIVASCNSLLVLTLHALEVISNHRLADAFKQNRIKTISISMLGKFSVLLMKLALLMVLTLTPAYIADHSGWLGFELAINTLMRVDLLIYTSVVMLALVMLIKKLKPAKQQAVNTSRYRPIERIMHNVAFGSAVLQRSLNTLELKLFRKQFEPLTLAHPVFITSLARSGTTVLLEALNTLPETCSHTYRDMPFIFSPIVWHKLSSRFRKKSYKRERAHGDGVLVNEDSPEAFEEVLWLKFFPQKYDEHHIYLWKSADSDFKNFFKNYMQRVALVRSNGQQGRLRYLSKNNANIARIPALQGMFPDAVILIPVREPFEHAISLLRQHENFGRQHEAEDFIEKYMADIGHFEFGNLHKRIQFPEDALCEPYTPAQVDYWLAYWISAYDYLAGLQGVHFIAYEDLCSKGDAVLQRINEKFGLNASSEHIQQAAALFKRTPTRKHDYDFDTVLAERAEKVYHALLNKAL